MERVVVFAFLSFFLAEVLLEFFLNELNLRHARRRSSRDMLPGVFGDRLSPETEQKWFAYALAKGSFQRWASLYGAAAVLGVLFSGTLPALERMASTAGSFLPPVAQAAGVLFCLGTAVGMNVLALPTELFATFVIEQRFGFNRTTSGLFFLDKLKGLAVGGLIGVPFLFGVLWLMDRGGATWWLWAFLFIFGFQSLIAVVYPLLIAPLFNKFEPLAEGELRRRILALAERVGFKAGSIFTMDGSRRSTHSNAYFIGLGGAKRIVLFDTLLRELTPEQGLAVLAHEMGHYRLKHIRRMLVVRGFLLAAGLFVLSRLLGYGPLFHAFGFDGPSSHAALVLFGFLASPATFYLKPLLNFLSRGHEYEADRFAAGALEDSRPLAEALVRLSAQNLANLAPHPWYSAYHYTHPTPAERVEALRRAGPSSAPPIRQV